MSVVRVVIVQEYVPEYRTSFFNLLGKKLAERNINLELVLDEDSVASNRNGDSAKTELPTLHVPSLRIYLGRRILKLRKISGRELTSDLVIVEQAAKNISTWALILIRGILRKPTALWGHGVDYVNRVDPLSRGLRRFMIRVTKHVFVYTASAKDALINEGIDASKMTTVQNSTDTLDLKNKLNEITSIECEEFREMQNLTLNMILFLGSLDASKNLELLFAASELAHQADPTLTLAVVGDGPLRPYVEEVAATTSWVKYLGRNENTKLLALASAKAIVVPGRVGLVATDALASGKPVVTARSALHAPEFDYLTENRTCLLAADSPLEISLKIREAITNEFQETSRTAALSDALEYSIERMVSNFESGINAALGIKSV